ncbi:(2Fe-2S)-binding protein [Rhizobium sp. WL3]|jgi:predicted molibdopterin-dependent oxidoreductase YjgC|uniref:(2Fe-2S)-binding protein n=1 Tax=Rhizobium rhizophilum TaxID=1850373 RepID=A0ABY2QXJ9_9HYPH|nr:MULTISPECIES: 2Fe-2S iron-sulfur cluster-binding protein [Rhizobium]MBX9468047.1 (2Fe-2S)-binding protein [Rhizobium sp.]QEE44328.1 (2Fe-2S)-binding protein [Rhizobium sp. WL3]THV15812.1 (2Fe-2S)-binding protein [Rhizobium rhizophilum]
MIQQTFHWQGRAIPFRSGESLAAALDAAGVGSFGYGPLGEETRYFCGIGACQNCLLRVDGLIREACITPARPGMEVEALEKPND